VTTVIRYCTLFTCADRLKAFTYSIESECHTVHLPERNSRLLKHDHPLMYRRRTTSRFTAAVLYHFSKTRLRKYGV